MAVTEWLPTDRAEVVRVATPLDRVPVPSTVVPSRKVTVPAGVPMPGATTLTVARKVTVWSEMDGLGVLLSTVVVDGAFTVWLTRVEVLVAKLVLPP